MLSNKSFFWGKTLIESYDARSGGPGGNAGNNKEKKEMTLTPIKSLSILFAILGMDELSAEDKLSASGRPGMMRYA